MSKGQGADFAAQNLGQRLRLYFAQDQGVRIGETAVVSRRVHFRQPRLFPHVEVRLDQDAGMVYCQETKPNQAVHLDLYHSKAQILLLSLGKRIWSEIQEFVAEQTWSQWPAEERTMLQEPALLRERIWVATAEGYGNLSRILTQDQAGNPAELTPPEDRTDHVHLVVVFSAAWYGCIYRMILAVETEILEQGAELRRVMGLTHTYTENSRLDLAAELRFPSFLNADVEFPEMQQQKQKHTLLTLAQNLGGIAETQRFLSTLQGNFWQRLLQAGYRKGALLVHGQIPSATNAEALLSSLGDAGLVAPGLVGPALTASGQELLHYCRLHQPELAALLRKIKRKKPQKSRDYKALGQGSSQQISHPRRQMKRRQIRLEASGGRRVLAIPETILAGVERSYREGLDRWKIQPKDLRFYGQKSTIPVDICLILDGSYSMAGEKNRAVQQLAEHLLLSFRDQVALVVFQERQARVAVPFTRNQKILLQGLRSLRPQGMTPLAHGLVESHTLLLRSRVHNPLVVLLTDGLPTYPYWTFNAQKDALIAAEKFAQTRAQFLCIGIRGNQRFLQELAQAGQGKLYVVDQFNRENLIQVVQKERSRPI